MQRTQFRLSQIKLSLGAAAAGLTLTHTQHSLITAIVGDATCVT
jgi:hypothetical protein